MANEVLAWKKVGCAISVAITELTERETFSREMNEAYGEGGGLNANYRTVEAVAIASHILGKIGLVYGTDFVWKTAGMDEISFDFRNDAVKKRAEQALDIATKGFTTVR